MNSLLITMSRPREEDSLPRLADGQKDSGPGEAESMPRIAGGLEDSMLRLADGLLNSRPRKEDSRGNDSRPRKASPAKGCGYSGRGQGEAARLKEEDSLVEKSRLQGQRQWDHG